MRIISRNLQIKHYPNNLIKGSKSIIHMFWQTKWFRRHLSKPCRTINALLRYFSQVFVVNQPHLEGSNVTFNRIKMRMLKWFNNRMLLCSNNLLYSWRVHSLIGLRLMPGPLALCKTKYWVVSRDIEQIGEFLQICLVYICTRT